MFKVSASWTNRLKSAYNTSNRRRVHNSLNDAVKEYRAYQILDDYDVGVDEPLVEWVLD